MVAAAALTRPDGSFKWVGRAWMISGPATRAAKVRTAAARTVGEGWWSNAATAGTSVSFPVHDRPSRAATTTRGV
jgi:hypothetical protein